jgi:integrase
LAALVEEELRRAAPLLVHEAVEQYLEYKRGQVRSERHVQAIGKSLCQFLPNVPVRSVTRQQAEDCYLAATKRQGKHGRSAAAATHRGRLRLVKAFWAWLRKRDLATDDPWSSVEPIGRVNTGKTQLGEAEARKLDQYLFGQAEDGDEGALALLLALYLGLRTSEVLGLTVGAIDGTTVFVAGTKTKNARRKLALYEPVAKLLARHCAGRPATQRVFAANLPQQPKPDWAYKRLRKACQRLEIPQVCPHSLRGLHSSLALEAGATTHQVASALGHASFATTARHYAKRDSIEKGKAKRVADVLHGSSPDPTVEQILARLPKDERRVLLSLIRA